MARIEARNLLVHASMSIESVALVTFAVAMIAALAFEWSQRPSQRR